MRRKIYKYTVHKPHDQYETMWSRNSYLIDSGGCLHIWDTPNHEQVWPKGLWNKLIKASYPYDTTTGELFYDGEFD